MNLHPLLPGQRFLRVRRKYIPRGLGVSGFLRKLQLSEIQHAVMFNSDEYVNSKSPLVVLVSDEDAQAAASLLSPLPSGLPCQLYSVTGLPGFGRGHVPLLPPMRAKEVLENAVPDDARAGLRPDVEQARLCAAYHRVYLSRQAAEAEDDALLDQAGWSPPLEMLERMADASPHARAKARLLAGMDQEKPGFTLFFIRQRAIDLRLDGRLRGAIASKGFEVLDAFPLQPHAAALAHEQVRGGNWGRGPYAKSGGGPAVVLAAFDLLPYPPRKIAGAEVDNPRILEAKRAARDLVCSAMNFDEQFNPVHSTDTASQAWRILRMIAPDEEARLRQMIDERRRIFETTEPVISNLTRFGNRAKVELVRYQGRLVVKKTYRPGAERFLRREIDCLEAFADRPEVPQLIASGENWLMIPFYENRLRERRVLGFRLPRLLPLAVTRQLAAFLEIAAGRGYDLIDLLPRNNLILDPKLGLKILDFEFAQRREDLCHAEQAYCLRGVPSDFGGDVPAGNYAAQPYPLEWKPMTGLSLESFLHDPAWLQQIKRAGCFVGLLVALALRKLREALPFRRLRSGQAGRAGL